MRLVPPGAHCGRAAEAGDGKRMTSCLRRHVQYGGILLLMLILIARPLARAAETSVPQGEAQSAWHLWGSREVESRSLTAFTKWTGMLARYRAERRRLAALTPGCDRQEQAARPVRARSFAELVALARQRRQAGGAASSRVQCAEERLAKLLAELAGKPLVEQLSAVNRFFNRAPYVLDPVNWGVPDYWASPGQFAAKDGDCEDYAIAKYLALRRLGVPARAMRIVVLEDRNLNTDHAVLAVRDAEGRIWILDNQTPVVVKAERIRHYRPVYSINEEAWWLHTAAPAAGRSGFASGLATRR